MENTVIVVILLLILILALLRMKKHFRGGGCCGSVSGIVRSKKKLSGPKLGQYVLSLEGMHCEKCQARIEHAVNDLEGAVCKVDLKKKTATITYSRPVSTEEIRQVIERQGYQVTGIR